MCSTWKDCLEEGDKKTENRLCIIEINNCHDGLECVDQDDGCNNGVGRCVKKGILNIFQILTKILEKGCKTKKLIV